MSLAFLPVAFAAPKVSPPAHATADTRAPPPPPAPAECHITYDTSSGGSADSSRPAPLAFSIAEGATENHFYRRGPVAAHLLATSGLAPRLIVAFPAGNTGIGLWFDALPQSTHLGLAPGTALESIEQPDGLRGVTAHLRSSAKSLTLRSALLANIRVIRDHSASGATAVPAEFAGDLRPEPPWIYRRTTIDGHHRIEVRLTSETETTITRTADALHLATTAPDGVAFTITALADDPPLTPFAPDELFTAAAADRPRDRQVFAFLASAEKFTAGSWRFLTYFGRDTLLTLQLLRPALQPPVIEAALGSVLERLGPGGEVAHEEAIGEFAALENRRRHPPPPDLLAPVLDYKMIDGDFLLAPALSACLLDTPAGHARAAGFLSRRTTAGGSYGDAVRRNLRRVLALAAPFSARPAIENLIALKPGIPVGNWRDSDRGLGGGRYPFDVNVALVPAALHAAARLYRSGLLGSDAGDTASALEAAHAAERWRLAEPFFRLTVPADRARARIDAYARSLRLNPAPAVASIDGPVTYHALALGADGQPVPVMNSDPGFVLFFSDPAPEFLDSIAGEITRPFPAGLRTAVGLVVANPVFGSEHVWSEFTRADYHGTVVWSWQQALMAAGLRRQLARPDLPAATRARLTAAQHALWQVIDAHRTESAGELWSWEPAAGHEALMPFGQGQHHADESNAAQLWSTVYLAVQPPP